MKIKKGDMVKVLTGKKGTKGVIGKVLQVLVSKKTKQPYVVVDGANMRKKHLRSRQKGYQGQVVEYAAPIHASNVQFYDEKNKQGTRLKMVQEGSTKQRVSVKSGDVVDN